MSDGSDHTDAPEGANPPGFGGQGEQSPWDAEGSVLGRLKSPASNTGRVTAQGERQGVGRSGEIADDAPPIQVGGVVTADSSISDGPDGGASYIGGSGGIAPHEAPGAGDVDRRRERRDERLVALWFMLSVAGTLIFVVVDVIGNTHRQYYTPVLGASLALALGGLGAGMITWAKKLMGDEEAVQEREHMGSPLNEVEATERVFANGFQTTGLARRPIIRRTLLLAGGALGLIGVVPILNLGPMSGRKPKSLGETSWRFTKPTTDAAGQRVPGIRMIDQFGRPIQLGDVAAGGLLTVFPALVPDPARPGFYVEPTLQVKGDSTVLLIRLHPGQLPLANTKDTYFDHIAFSKICTHAGCPVSLYEQQTHHLLCPCHQSIFDVADHARPIFGPAARPLPQLAINVDDEGYFIATGDFNQPVGPTFWERG